LFQRSCYLSDFIKNEEYIPEYISAKNRKFFDYVINFMMEKRILIPRIEEVGDKKEQSKNLVCLRTSGESQIIFI
jgi:hypothetical protein